MKTVKHWWLKRGVIYLVIVFVLSGSIFVKKFGFPPYYQTEAAVEQLSQSTAFSRHNADLGGNRLHLVSVGKPQDTAILFIHGSPGQWTAWADYLLDEELRQAAFMIAVDRPGFGRSDEGHHEPSLKKQVHLIIEAVSKKFPDQKKFIVAGHSYGGPVALRMAIDYPDKVTAISLLAPSVSPDLEEMRWYNKAAALPVIKNILPTAIQRSNAEILPLKKELFEMKPLLKNIKVPVSVIHGDQDNLVPVGNAYFAKEALTKTDVHLSIIPERGHFVPWQDYELVKKTLLSYIERAP